MHSSRIAAVTVALVVGGLSVASPAWAAADTWHDPAVELSTSAVDTWSDSVQVVPGAEGTLMAMWIEAGPDVSQLRSALWSAGAWSIGAPATVSDPAGGDIDDFQLVARGDGSFVAIWIELTEDGDFQQFSNVVSNVFVGGSWLTPAALMTSAAGEETTDLHFAAAPDGSAIAAWDREGTINTVILESEGWGLTQHLGDGSNPRVAASPTNVLAITWNLDVPVTGNVPAAKTYTGTTWSDTVQLSDEGGFAPELGASPTGFVALWMEGSSRLPWASTFNGTSWSAPVAMKESNDLGGGLTSPGYVVSTSDVTAVTWTDGGFDSAIIWMRTFNGTTWSEPVELLAASEVGVENNVVATDDGTFMIAWAKNGGGPLTARTFTATTLGAPFALGSEGSNPWGYNLAAAPNGAIAATWQEGSTVFASIFDGTSWSASPTDFGSYGSARIASTSDNVFVLAWVWESDDRALIRASWIDAPGNTTGSGGELAETGTDPLVAVAAAGAGLALLIGALLLMGTARRSSRSRG